MNSIYGGQSSIILETKKPSLVAKARLSFYGLQNRLGFDLFDFAFFGI